ncbi:MAG: DUF1559 domain-containing protein [Thermoguttaceae bacterium]|nr:DUF1559 domain-containing protein [Thermoguttaceae bacterium]
MFRMRRVLSVILILSIAPLLFGGCRKGEPGGEELLSRRAAEARQGAAAAVFPDEIRSLSGEELAELPPRNTFPTEMIVPGALAVRVIQPERFLRFSQADKVIRFFANSPQLVPFSSQFDQIELIITSTKVAPVSLFDTQSGEQVGENYPLPCSAVYARKNEPVNREAFLGAQFGRLPKERIETRVLGGTEVTISENSLILPLDPSGKNTARIDGVATAVVFPSENEALMVTGPIRSVEGFFTAGEGEKRGVLAQRVGRAEADSFDFGFFYDYASAQKEAITLPVPPALRNLLLEETRFLSLSINASAPEGEPALRLEITADTPESLNRIDEELGNTLLQIDESLRAAAPEGDSPAQGGMAPLLPRLSETLRSITQERNGNVMTAALAMSADRAELFGQLVDQMNLFAENSAKENRRAQTAGNLKVLGDVINAYYAKNNHYPPLAITSPEGTPLLSWRVALLPAMGPEGEALYKEFKIDEPWDSETNLKLLDRVPMVYRSPLLPAGSGKTLFRIFTGEGVPLRLAGDPPKMNAFENPGRTFLVVAVDPSQAVEWTRPDELNFDRGKLREVFGDFVLALPVMGELFTAPLSGTPEEFDALTAWITGVSPEGETEGETPEETGPGPGADVSPLEN